jgi:Protein of unknown function (DUF3604)
MSAYDGLSVYYGDIHNHSGISYGLGTIDEAMANARERLDFCSVTGHAHWPDMPPDGPRLQHIIDFHKEGFARLEECWGHVQDVTRRENADGEFVTFLSFEVHSLADGDYTVLYRDGQGEILRQPSIPAMLDRIAELNVQGVATLAFPHHIGYLRGRRGLNWDTFRRDVSPVVEMISMHGCSEGNENTRPFLHVMGPSDWRSTLHYGLEQGRTFGVIGSTDHHSSHPGSYGHGMCGVWANKLTREAIWDAIVQRRTYALTGDRIALQFSVNDAPMGAEIAGTDQRSIRIDVRGGYAIDCVDVVKNGRLLRRFSECDVEQRCPGETVRTLVFLELGWSDRGVEAQWDVDLGVDSGSILAIEPRFRGQEVVSPLEKEEGSSTSYHCSHWDRTDDSHVRFNTVTFGNPNNATPGTQGMCLEVEMPVSGKVEARINGQDATVSLERLLKGTVAGDTQGFHSPAFRFHRAPLAWEYNWQLTLNDDGAGNTGQRDVYYARVRQKNDQWAWSSPVYLA